MPVGPHRSLHPGNDVPGGSLGPNECRDRAPSTPTLAIYRASGSEARHGNWSDTTTTQCAPKGRRVRVSRLKNSDSRHSRRSHLACVFWVAPPAFQGRCQRLPRRHDRSTTRSLVHTGTRCRDYPSDARYSRVLKCGMRAIRFVIQGSFKVENARLDQVIAVSPPQR